MSLALAHGLTVVLPGQTLEVPVMGAHRGHPMTLQRVAGRAVELEFVGAVGEAAPQQLSWRPLCQTLEAGVRAVRLRSSAADEEPATTVAWAVWPQPMQTLEPAFTVHGS